MGRNLRETAIKTTIAITTTNAPFISKRIKLIFADRVSFYPTPTKSLSLETWFMTWIAQSLHYRERNFSIWYRQQNISHSVLNIYPFKGRHQPGHGNAIQWYENIFMLRAIVIKLKYFLWNLLNVYERNARKQWFWMKGFSKRTGSSTEFN